MYVINSLAPVFLLIGLGCFLSGTQFFSPEFFKGVNRLTFHVGLPALLFCKVVAAGFDTEAVSKTLTVLFLVTFATMGLAYAVRAAMRLPSSVTGSFVQGAFRSNLTYIGLSVVIYALGGNREGEDIAVLTLAPMVVLYNVISVIVLVRHRSGGAGGHTTLKIVTDQVATNPLILAAVAAFAVKFTGLQVPIALWNPLKMLGQSALPLALMSIGASLSFERLRTAAVPSFVASLIKVCVSPLFGLLLVNLLHLSVVERQVVLVFLACPTAVSSYVMAEVLGNDEVVAGRIVVVSSLMSAVSLTVVIACIGS